MAKKVTKDQTTKAKASSAKTKQNTVADEAQSSSAASQPKPETEKKTKTKKPHATRPTPEEELIIAERRSLVWDLYKSGLTFRQISEILKKKNIQGNSVGQVHADVQFSLSLQYKELGFSVKQHVENECAIVNDIQNAFYLTAKKPPEPVPGGWEAKCDAAGIVLSCVEKRAKLRNLYKPQEIKINAAQILSKLTGVPIEKIPNNERDK